MKWPSLLPFEDIPAKCQLPRLIPAVNLCVGAVCRIFQKSHADTVVKNSFVKI